jgi:hypothetical protein
MKKMSKEGMRTELNYQNAQKGAFFNSILDIKLLWVLNNKPLTNTGPISELQHSSNMHQNLKWALP